MYYCEIDIDNHDYRHRKYFYDYISSLNHEYGVGIAWDKEKSPMFLIEKVELVCTDPGGYLEPPFYQPEGAETIIVRPKLKFPKR